MATIDKMTVTVEAKVEVSDDTCLSCLKLVEIWLNNNRDKRIVGGFRDGVNSDVLPFKIEKRVNDG